MSTPLNDSPYVSPADTSEESSSAHTPVGTGGLTAIAVFGIIFAILALLGVCSGAVGVFFQGLGWGMPGTGPTPGQTPEMEKAFNDYMQALQAEQTAILPGTVASLVGHLVFGVALLWGSILLFRRQEFGRKLMWSTCAAGIPLEIANVVFAGYVQYRTMTIVSAFITAMMDASPEPAPSEAQQFLKGGMFVMMGLGMLFAVLWAGGKITYFYLSVKYLGGARCRTLFEPKSS